MNEFPIQVENLSKRYRIGMKQEVHDTLTSVFTSWLKSPLSNYSRLRKLSRFRDDENDEDIIWALRDVSFNVRQGEVIGIIGRNGAGKSTLLKIISRITQPTSGRVVLNGRVASLLEVGTGFHPELTGRENIYLNGAVLGMSKPEIDGKFDEIVHFSENEKFLDTPVKRYSSGMRVRLAFAVAAHLEPEILLIDEVLAVGDAAFQKKCLGKMGEVAKQGRTVLFVSHNLGAINNLCQKAVVIEEGRLIYEGDAGEGVGFYINSLYGDNSETGGIVEYPEDLAKPIQVQQISITNNSGEINTSFEYLDAVFVDVGLALRTPKEGYYALFFIFDGYGNTVFISADDDLKTSDLSEATAGSYVYRIPIPVRLLKPGRYFVSISLTQRQKTGGPIDRHELALSFDITDNLTKRAVNNGYRSNAVVAPEIQWQLLSA